MSDWRNEPIKSTGFDAQIKHEDGYELHFYTDRLEAYRAVEKVCQNQLDRKPKTNADKIRAMTDEELATLFTKVMAGNSGVRLDGIWQEKGMEENQRYFTRLNWLDWLKKEANIRKICGNCKLFERPVLDCLQGKCRCFGEQTVDRFALEDACFSFTPITEQCNKAEGGGEDGN